MDKAAFERELEKALETLRQGGTILYPTDTVWGIGCDASNPTAVQQVYSLKGREEKKSLIILLAEERDLLQYVAAPDLEVFDYIERQERPTTVIFDGAVGLPDNLIANDGSIGIRIVRDPFCRHLVKRLRKPLVSTSANISGQPTPSSFAEIDPAIKNDVDHVVKWRQEENARSRASRIVKWKDGEVIVIRD